MSKIEALDIAPYVSDKDAFFDRIVYDGKKMDLFKYDDPKILDAGGIAICMEGSVEFSIDTRSYILHKGDMCVFFPQMTIQPSNRSKDLKLYIAFVNVDFFQNFMHIARPRAAAIPIAGAPRTFSRVIEKNISSAEVSLRNTSALGNTLWSRMISSFPSSLSSTES